LQRTGIFASLLLIFIRKTLDTLVYLEKKKKVWNRKEKKEADTDRMEGTRRNTDTQMVDRKSEIIRMREQTQLWIQGPTF
jgi:hypothetical protein